MENTNYKDTLPKLLLNTHQNLPKMTVEELISNFQTLFMQNIIFVGSKLLLIYLLHNFHVSE